MKKMVRYVFSRVLAVGGGVMLLHATAASAQTPATISLTCPVSVLNNTTYDVEVKVNVGSGAPCVPPGQSAAMCGLGAYNLALTHNTARANLVQAAAGFPIQGGTSNGFTSQPPPTPGPPPTPTPNCDLGCQQPVTDAATFPSGTTPVSAFNTSMAFDQPVGTVSIMRAKVQAIALGNSDVGVSSTNLQAFDTVGASFAVAMPVPNCRTAVSQYSCLGDRPTTNSCVSASEAICAVNCIGKSITDPTCCNVQADADNSTFISSSEAIRVVNNLGKCLTLCTP